VHTTPYHIVPIPYGTGSSQKSDIGFTGYAWFHWSLLGIQNQPCMRRCFNRPPLFFHSTTPRFFFCSPGYHLPTILYSSVSKDRAISSRKCLNIPSRRAATASILRTLIITLLLQLVMCGTTVQLQMIYLHS